MRVDSWKTLWRYVAGVFGCALLAYFPFVQQRRVPLLGGVDLGFHELGHMLTYVFPEIVTALMGSVFQVAIPAGLAAYFGLRRRDLLAAGLCLAWAGTSAVDVSVYIADAPFQRLPLIGGSHDWAYLLGPAAFGNMGGAAAIAGAVKAAGAALVLAGMGLCFRGPFVERVRVPGASPTRSAVLVREPHRWADPESLVAGSSPELNDS